MKFQYAAKDRHGNSTHGQFEGESALAVRQKLRTQGLFVLSLVSADSTFSGRPSLQRVSGSPAILGANFNRVKGSDLIVALSQLSIMCHSGDDLAEALRTVANQCQSPKLRQVLLSTYEDVTQGVKFSAALARHPRVFSESLVAALAAGEQAGRVVCATTVRNSFS